MYWRWLDPLNIFIHMVFHLSLFAMSFTYALVWKPDDQAWKLVFILVAEMILFVVVWYSCMIFINSIFNHILDQSNHEWKMAIRAVVFIRA